VAVESAVEKHISRLDMYAASKPGFDKGTGENHAGIAVRVHMTRRGFAPRKHFKSDDFPFVFELRPHV
jgi:hypothetical protein